MEQLIAYLKQHLEVSAQDWEYIKNKVTLNICNKGTILTKAGDVENNLYFITDGVFRLYFEKDDKEIMLNFGFPGSFISSYASFLTQEKSTFHLSALTSCTYLNLEKKELEDIYNNTSCGHKLAKILTENLYLYFSNRENSFLLKSPTERYLELHQEKPQYISEIPLKFLASYIGITPQALSRIRAKLAQSIS